VRKISLVASTNDVETIGRVAVLVDRSSENLNFAYQFCASVTRLTTRSLAITYYTRFPCIVSSRKTRQSQHGVIDWINSICLS